MTIKNFSMISVCAFLCNFAFAGDIELTKHINTHILQNNKYSWGQKEIGQEASFNVIKDINYLYYVEQNCDNDKILKNSEFYKNTWTNIFGQAKQDSLANMIAQIYTKSDDGKNLKQSQINTLYYMYTLLSRDFKEFNNRFSLQKNSQAKTVNERYISGWGIKEFGTTVGNAISDYNKTYELSIDNRSVFTEKEQRQIDQRKKVDYKEYVPEQLRNLGIFVKEGSLKIGSIKVIKPELRNETHCHVFDTGIINTFGSFASGINDAVCQWNSITAKRQEEVQKRQKQQDLEIERMRRCFDEATNEPKKKSSIFNPFGLDFSDFENSNLSKAKIVFGNKADSATSKVAEHSKNSSSILLPSIPVFSSFQKQEQTEMSVVHIKPCEHTEPSKIDFDWGDHAKLLDTPEPKETKVARLARQLEADGPFCQRLKNLQKDIIAQDTSYLETAQNFVRAVVESAVEFGAELVTPGGVENYQKFKAGKISAFEYTNLVAQDMARDATAAAIGAQIGGGLGGAAGFAMAGGGSIPGAAAGSTAGAAIGTAISRAGTAISRTLNKEKHESTILMNENHSKSAGGKTEKVVDREAQRKVGNVGRYKDLTTPGGFNDGKDAHHMPSQKYLKDNGLNTKEGLSVIIEKKLHSETRTYLNKAKQISTDKSYRDELATDLKDYKKVLQEEGVWKDRRKDLIDGLDKYKNANPELFKKEQK